MSEPLKKCRRCGFAMHVMEYECVKCQILDAQEIALKREIGKYYRAKMEKRQRYTYLTDPHDLEIWAGEW